MSAAKIVAGVSDVILLFVGLVGGALSVLAACPWPSPNRV